MAKGTGTALIAAQHLTILGSSDPIDLSIASCERVGLLGTRGSGKRSLLQVLARLRKPDEGRILWNGVEVSRRPRWLMGKLRSHALMVWADPYALFGDDNDVGSVVAEVQSPDGNGGDAAGPSLRMLGTATMASLSATQRVRAALAYARAQTAQVVLFDDIFTALSPAAWPNLMQEITDTIAAPRALVIASQYRLPMTYVDRICVLREGAIVEEGPSRRILSNPQHPYTRWLVRRDSLRIVETGDWTEDRPFSGNRRLPSSEELP